MKRWLVVVALAAGACSKAPSDDQCRQLLEHLIDLEFKKGGATAAGGTAGNEAVKGDLEKQKAAVQEAKTADFMAACTEKTHRDRVTCALAATDLAGVQKCDEAR